VAGAPRGGERFELLAGERRLRAATDLGWTEIPAIIRDVDDRTALTLALIENLQRSDLNAIEEAEGYSRLVREFSLTQQEVSEVVGKDRSTVANMLRLLTLPAGVQDQVRGGALTVGHARALLSFGSEREILAAAAAVVSRGLTVRELEDLSRDTSAPPKRRSRSTKAAKRLDAHGKEVEDRLRRFLQTDVRLSLSARDRGQVSILFYSNDDLERILELILGRSGERL
jgi:ParB family chromosome partitioning protein